MRRIRIVGVVGARPDFMKMAPIARILRRHPRFDFSLIHTGQHYNGMSDPFFRDLNLPEPHYHLKVGSTDAARQIGLIVTRLAQILQDIHPSLVIVVGDVNSTIAGSLAAHKMGIPVAHVEAGLRSFDDSMPEEINRRITDYLSSYCFTHSPEADRNLLREGIPASRIHRVGNLMIDTLNRLKPLAERSRILKELNLEPRRYALITLHRPSNVDTEAGLRKFKRLLNHVGRRITVVFPIHPRTRASANRFGIWVRKEPWMRMVDPLGYKDFLLLQSKAAFVMTDSGGIQEETTVLGVPCLTLRDNTERPITIRQGTNRLAGTRLEGILRHVDRILAGDLPPRRIPPLWDGRAGERLVRVLENELLDG